VGMEPPVLEEEASNLLRPTGLPADPHKRGDSSRGFTPTRFESLLAASLGVR
jgi:hypothetical protein